MVEDLFGVIGLDCGAINVRCAISALLTRLNVLQGGWHWGLYGVVSVACLAAAWV